MNNLQIFDYKGNEVRTVEKDGVVWWVLKDVCSVLNMKENSAGEVVKRLDKDEYDSIGVTDKLGREQITYVINESGLYNVILRSDKPEAKPFRKWVTSEVLPTIRETGGYSIQKYAPKATSVGEIVNLIRVARETMQAQGCSSADIAQAVKQICEQFGVNLPKCFIKPKETTLQDVYDMIDFIFEHKDDKTPPTYDDFIIQASIKRLEG